MGGRDTEVYDSIASEYQESKQLPFRGALEAYTLFELLGDMRGSDCLRPRLRRRLLHEADQAGWAAAVTGVDISAEMVQLAREAERRQPLGCRYVCQDAAEFAPEEPADIVTAVYLFNYARTPAQLQHMCQAARAALRAGGRLVALNDNCLNPPPTESGAWTKYGFDSDGSLGSCTRARRFAIGLRRKTARTLSSTTTSWSRRRTVIALTDAGFVNIEWVDLRLEPGSRGDPFWDDFLASPPLIALRADAA